MLGQGSADPILLAAQARQVLEKLHKQNDVVVRFKTDASGFREDATDEDDAKNPGHFRSDKNVLTLNLDTLIKGKKVPKLDSIEDFRLYPVLAGVAAHESGHARWTLWDEIPESIPNPDFDPFAAADEDGKNPTGPETFPVKLTGKLFEMANNLEEPRIERLGVNTFTKTWKRAMQFSAGHLILENIDKMDAEDKSPLDAAVELAIIVGGRSTAGTLGATYESRQSIKAILDSAQKIIEESLPDVEDPFHTLMGIINEAVFSNEHEDAVPHLEAARRILKIVHPEEAEDPDNNPKGDPDDEGEEGDGTAPGMPGAGESAGMREMADAMRGAADALTTELAKMVESEEEAPLDQKGSGGVGSTLYKNPRAPQIDRHEQPTAADRELYHRARDWMQQQVEPTVTESEYGQWLPVGGARLDLRSMVRDNLAGHRGSQRSDWNRVSETVKPAPPVKVAIMLDGSGSMRSMARPSASIAWAAANAAADLPESRTVSVVYGNAAQVTQAPGHLPARTVAVSKTDGGTEAFIDAAKMVEDALWLDERVEDGEPTNVLIIIVSDLMYGGQHRHPNGKTESQMDGFIRIVADWAERGYQVVVVGADKDGGRGIGATGYASKSTPSMIETARKAFTVVEPPQLFR